MYSSQGDHSGSVKISRTADLGCHLKFVRKSVPAAAILKKSLVRGSSGRGWSLEHRWNSEAPLNHRLPQLQRAIFGWRSCQFYGVTCPRKRTLDWGTPIVFATARCKLERPRLYASPAGRAGTYQLYIVVGSVMGDTIAQKMIPYDHAKVLLEMAHCVMLRELWLTSRVMASSFPKECRRRWCGA